MTLCFVRLELARSKEFPHGDSAHGYEFTAPLDESSHLDASAWRSSRQRCTVRRFSRDAADENGMLVHVGHGWHFDYVAKTRDDDEALFKLDRHVIKQGEYVSITEHDGVLRTFKVMNVCRVAGA